MHSMPDIIPKIRPIVEMAIVSPKIIFVIWSLDAPMLLSVPISVVLDFTEETIEVIKPITEIISANVIVAWNID